MGGFWVDTWFGFGGFVLGFGVFYYVLGVLVGGGWVWVLLLFVFCFVGGLV